MSEWSEWIGYLFRRTRRDLIDWWRDLWRMRFGG